MTTSTKRFNKGETHEPFDKSGRTPMPRPRLANRVSVDSSKTGKTAAAPT